MKKGRRCHCDMHPNRLKQAYPKGEIAMRARKCNVFFERDLQAWCDDLGQYKMNDAVGITFALEFAKAIMWMCLTGKKFGCGEGDIAKLPMALRGCHKFFLDGWEESVMLMKMIKSSTRVEVKVSFYNERIVMSKVTFFRKGRVILGHYEMLFDIVTGRLEASGRALVTPT